MCSVLLEINLRPTLLTPRGQDCLLEKSFACNMSEISLFCLFSIAFVLTGILNLIWTKTKLYESGMLLKADFSWGKLEKSGFLSKESGSFISININIFGFVKVSGSNYIELYFLFESHQEKRKCSKEYNEINVLVRNRSFLEHDLDIFRPDVNDSCW